MRRFLMYVLLTALLLITESLAAQSDSGQELIDHLITKAEGYLSKLEADSTLLTSVQIFELWNEAKHTVGIASGHLSPGTALQYHEHHGNTTDAGNSLNGIGIILSRTGRDKEAEETYLITDIDNLNLDVDMTIPLGLVSNELLTNTLKHAFLDSNMRSAMKTE